MTIIFFVLSVFVFGILIFVHELGHFIMARLSGIAVDAFSIGFGPELIGFDLGGTRFRLSAFPLGGYCKMRGGDNGVDPSVSPDDPHSFINRPAWARLLAILGGPGFNYLFAALLLSALFLVGFQETRLIPSVQVIAKYEDGKVTPAAAAGLKTGDSIVGINGKRVKTLNDVYYTVAMSIDKKTDLEISRGGSNFTLSLVPVKEPESGLGDIGIYSLLTTKLDSVGTNTPAEKSGMKAGDTILAINGVKISWFYELQALVAPLSNQLVALEYQRGNNVILTNILVGRFNNRGYLGVTGSALTEKVAVPSKPFVQAIGAGFEATHRNLTETLAGLKEMIRGKIDLQKNVSGPVRMVVVTKQVIEYGDPVVLIKFLALISVALAFFNFLPIPGLDGGHILFNLVEMITRRPLPVKVRNVIEVAGFFTIVALSVLVLFNDIFNVRMGR